MAFERAGPGLFAVGLGLRAVLVGGLSFSLVLLLVHTQLYATALLLAGVIALVVSDVARSISRADQVLEQFADSLAMDGLERPVLPPQGFFRSSAAIDRALARMGRARSAREGRLHKAESLVDTVSAALLVIDADGGVELANRAARRLAGREAARLRDLAALDPAATQAMLGLAPGGRAMLRLADGRPMLALAAAFRLPGGEARRLVSLQPVTGELDAVEQKAWRDLAHILAHEMMNSLTPIVSLSETVPALLQRGAAEDAAEAAGVISRRATGLMAFVDGYRRFADLPPPEPASFPADAFLAGIERLMRPGLEARDVAYESMAAPIWFNADRQLLEQAVINLVKNAADAVEGRPAARVWVDCAEADGRVVIRVADNGPGVAAEDRERIFVPFFTTRAKGSGVGLSLARQIAVAHAGYLDVVRNEPEGSVFRLVLPGI